LAIPLSGILTSLTLTLSSLQNHRAQAARLTSTLAGSRRQGVELIFGLSLTVPLLIDTQL
jgi:hypothetical protein